MGEIADPVVKSATATSRGESRQNPGVARLGRPPKSLAEHWRDGTFRHDRHGHLLKKVRLDAGDVATVLELDREGLAAWQIAGRLECTLGAVLSALRLHRPPAS